MRQRSFKFSGASCIAVAATLLAGVPAFAEAAAPSGAPTADAAGRQGLEEIVVTARKQVESAQNAPVSVTAVSGKQIEAMNLTRLSELTQIAPNIKITQVSGSSIAPLIFIRGVGQVSAAFYSEPPIGVYIDGVYLPRPTGNGFDLPDLDRVEVLRGPQGTLFGRNTTGGAILLYTADPKPDFGGSLKASYGSENEIDTSVVLHTGQIGGSPFRAKLTFSHHERDGWVDFPGIDKSSWGGSQNSTAVSGTIMGDLSDTFTVRNSLSYNRLRAIVGFQNIDATPAVRAYYGQGPSLGGPPVVFSDRPTDLVYRYPDLQGATDSFKSILENFTATWKPSDKFNLKSITAYGHITYQKPDQIGGSYTLGRVSNPTNPANPIEPVFPHVTPSEPARQHQFSEELQASGQLGDFNYVGGLYYYDEHTAETINTITTAVNAAGTLGTKTRRGVSYTTAVKSTAAYAQVDYKPEALDRKLDISLGGRLTHDSKDLFSQTTTNGVTGAAQTLSNGWGKPGWSGSVSYQWTPQVMTYVRAASAFRAGGYNATSTGAPPFDPETAITYEGGFKTQWWDNRFRFNVAAFQTDYKNLQINQYNTVTLTNMILNAAKARYKGIEVESALQPARWLRIDGNFGYVDPRYIRYNNLGPGGTIVNAADQAKFPYVSKYGATIGAQLTSEPTAAGVFGARIDFNYRSSAPFVVLASFNPLGALHDSGSEQTLNANISFSDIPLAKPENHLKFSIYGDNLTNHRYLVTASDFGTSVAGAFNRPRSYGVQAGLSF